MATKKLTSIRVGQRLVNHDGLKGYVNLNSGGKAVFGPGESFMVIWTSYDSYDNQQGVEGADYYTLETLEQEGITLGRGVMPWAR